MGNAGPMGDSQEERHILVDVTHLTTSAQRGVRWLLHRLIAVRNLGFKTCVKSDSRLRETPIESPEL